MSTTKNMPLNWYYSMKKKLRKIRIIFGVENLLWMSEIGIFRALDLDRMLIWQIFLWKSAIYHSIKIQFDAEVAEKILNVILCTCTPCTPSSVGPGHVRLNTANEPSSWRSPPQFLRPLFEAAIGRVTQPDLTIFYLIFSYL